MSLEDPVSAYCLWEENLAYPLQIHDRSDLSFLLTQHYEKRYEARAFSERIDNTFRYCQITS